MPATIPEFQSTLPRGERQFSRKKTFVSGHFNPRSREGSDYIKKDRVIKIVEFQSTLPRGERPGGDGPAERNKYDFNPRSREGSDEFYEDFSEWLEISIHAPARGATEYNRKMMLLRSRFQSTLPRGERHAAGVDQH